MGRAVGLRGEVEVLVISDDPKRFIPGSVLYTAGDERPLTVRGARPAKERTVVSFAEITDRTAAEALRGSDLVVPVEDARGLEEGEYWDHDLVGCTVETSDGTEIGTVTDVLHQPANEVLVVGHASGEVLVPLVATVVKEVLPRERITIEAPPGLLSDE